MSTHVDCSITAAAEGPTRHASSNTARHSPHSAAQITTEPTFLHIVAPCAHAANSCCGRRSNRKVA
jgi:hypothetical protein